MGRIKVRKERKCTICFAVSEDERQRLIELAREKDVSLSDYCRKKLLQKSED